MRISYFDETALADVGARVSADSLPELVTGAAKALLGLLISETEQLPEGHAATLVIQGDDPAALVRAVLEELVFRKDAEGAVFEVAETTVTGSANRGSANDPSGSGATGPSDGDSDAPAAPLLEARLTARRIELADVPELLGTDVKAITFHDFRVTERGDGSWEATVVFDV
jgi:SHS2 domain-containing protein